ILDLNVIQSVDVVYSHESIATDLDVQVLGVLLSRCTTEDPEPGRRYSGSCRSFEYCPSLLVVYFVLV
ncbi:hypothetical protein BRD01_08190, partial [Halobacteriales archaeon QS_8_65_32]